jgi:uroporphyrinogen III methyltransferase/synthase
VSVYLVGAGCGSPGLLTRDALECVSAARHIVYDRLIHPDILQLAPSSCEFHLVGKKERNHTMGQDEINDLLVSLGRTGETVVRLKGGDPFVFGRGGEEAEYLEKYDIPWRAIPGITSALGGSLLAGLPTTHRRNSSSVTMATAHRRCGVRENDDAYWRDIASSPGTLALYMGTSNFAETADLLMANGKPPGALSSVVHWGGWARARRMDGTLEGFALMARARELPSPSIIYIGDASGIKLSPEAGPMRGMQVAVCRPYPECWETGRALERLSADCYGLPLLSLERIDPDESSIDSIATADWLVLTSPRGASRLAEVLGDMRRIKGRIVSIGKGTSEMLRRIGIISDMESDGSGKGLAETLKNVVSPGETVVFARNERASDEAVTASRSVGAEARIVSTYRMVPREVPGLEVMREQWASCGLDAVVFGSSEMAREYSERLGRPPKGTSLVAWGEKCANSVRNIFGIDAVVMRTPDMDGLIRALATRME